MSSFAQQQARSAQLVNKKREVLKAQMRHLKNRMDFIEIISNFLPLPDLDAKIDQIERQMEVLNQQYQQQAKPRGPWARR